ncbi:MAG: hypothetical protein IRY83_07735 [Chloroflexi bacterium]|nr:hypothetical protein [Chloroflexota bacterium]
MHPRDQFGHRRRQFLAELPEMVRSLLPPDLRGFIARPRGGLVQLYYDDPGVHYEAWYHWRTNRLELGLHFEKDAAENARYFDLFDRYIIEIKHELGETVELERWDRGWARLYESWPYDGGRAFEARMAERLARMIAVLQPILDSAIRAEEVGRE